MKIIVRQWNPIVRQERKVEMKSIKVSVWLSKDLYEMLTTLEAKEKDKGIKEKCPYLSRPDIIRAALREYYSRRMEKSTNDAYVSLVTSTLNEVLAPYLKIMTDSIQRLTRSTEKVDQSLQLESLMNRMCFNLLFREGNLPEEEDVLYRVLKKRTPFDDVLEKVAEEKNTYNSSDTDE